MSPVTVISTSDSGSNLAKRQEWMVFPGICRRLASQRGLTLEEV